MQDLNDMYLFAKVVEGGGYTAASRLLGIPVSKISRRIAALEGALGVRLLNRTTRKVSVTDVGQTFYRHCAALVAEATAAKDAIDRTTSQPQGLIRVSCPVSLLQSDVARILSAYLAAHPLVRIRLEATHRRVDVIEEGFDLAIRVRQPPFEDSDLVIRPLATAQGVLVATPRFFAAHGKPASIGDLSDLPTLSMAQAGEKYSWRFIGADGAEVVVAHVPRLITDDLATLRSAVLDHVGIACLPTTLVADDLAAGALESALCEYSLPHGIVQVVFASRRGLVPAVRELIDMLVEAFRQ